MTTCKTRPVTSVVYSQTYKRESESCHNKTIEQLPLSLDDLSALKRFAELINKCRLSCRHWLSAHPPSNSKLRLLNPQIWLGAKYRSWGCCASNLISTQTPKCWIIGSRSISCSANEARLLQKELAWQDDRWNFVGLEVAPHNLGASATLWHVTLITLFTHGMVGDSVRKWAKLWCQRLSQNV